MAGAMGGLFSGLLKGFGTTLLEQKRQKHDDEIHAQDQRINLYTDAIRNGDLDPQVGYPLIASIISPTLEAQSGKGKGKKGEKGGLGSLVEQFHDPDTLSSFLMGLHGGMAKMGPTGLPAAGPVAKGQPSESAQPPAVDPSLARTQSGQPAPQEPLQARSGESSNIPPSLFRSRAQRVAEDTAAKRSDDVFKTDQQIRLENVRGANRLEEIKARPGVIKEGTKPTAFEDIPEDQRGPGMTSGKFYIPQMIGDRVAGWRAVQEPNKPAAQSAGTFFDALKRKEGELGHTLTSAELLKFRNDWAKANANDTPEQKLERAKVLASYRSDLGKPPGEAYAADVTTTSTGKKYLDLSTYDVKGRQGARQWAEGNGVTPVTKEQSNALIGIDTARFNIRDMREGILGKLPKDASGRLTVGPENLLKQYFKTDEDLAAWGAYREAAVQQVRAMQGVGSGQYRLTQQMVNLVINNDIPTLDDPVGVAQKKFETVEKLLKNTEDSIVVKDRSTLPPDTNKRDEKPSAVPAKVSDVLKDKPSARYKVGDTYYVKAKDGTIRPITKAEYEK